MSSKIKKIGILGGSFNPPHRGHFLIAKKILKKFNLDKIIFIPTGIQPLKSIEQLAPAQDRYEMTKFLVKKNKRFIISDIEIKEAKKGKKSYTIETITKLKKKYLGAELYLIIGEDSLQEILQGKWKKGFTLFTKVKFIVVSRRGYKPDYNQLKRRGLMKKIQFIKVDISISSTEIRERIKNSQDIKKYVFNEVANYIIKKGLYQRKIYVEWNKIPQHLFFVHKKAKKIIKDKIKEIRQYFRKVNFQKGIIGLSGGLDSAVAAVLAAKALSSKNLIVVRMPYQGISDKKSLDDARQLAKSLKIPQKNILTIPINQPVDVSWQLLKKFSSQGGGAFGGSKSNDKVRKGNLMARERMKILFDLSQAFKAIVIGTEDRTEEELGYYTLWGDQASGIEPIKNLWKTQVYQLASFFKEIPDEILTKAPSPDLWKGQSAEKEMGINYLDVDIVLSAYQDLKMTKKVIAKKFNISLKKINKILARAKIGQIKKTIPYILKH